MIDLASSVVTLKGQGGSSTSASTQTDASELLSTSDASNEQKFLTSSSCPKLYSSKFRRLEEKTQLKEEISLVVETKVICCLDVLLQPDIGDKEVYQ